MARLIAAMVGCLCAAVAVAGPPDVPDPWAEGVVQAYRERKLLVLHLEREPGLDRAAGLRAAMADPGVAAWLGEHAVVVPVTPRGPGNLAWPMRDLLDYFDLIDEALDSSLLAVRDGDLLGAVAEAEGGAFLLAWLEGMAGAPTRLGAAQRDARRAAERGDDAAAAEVLVEHFRSVASFDATLVPAEQLFEEAWRAALCAGWAEGVPLLAELGMQLPKLQLRVALIGQECIESLRDGHEALLAAGAAEDIDLAAWILLNRQLGDHGRIAAWAGRNKDQPGARAYFDSPWLDVFDSLVEAGAWRLAGETVSDPVAEAHRRVRTGRFIEHTLANRVNTPAHLRDGILFSQRAEYAARLANLYAACLAADRVRDAELILEAVGAEREDAHALRLALAMSAADAGVSRDEHVAWLDGIEGAGLGLPAGLRERVEANLRGLPR